jgi:cation/acetate symporter
MIVGLVTTLAYIIYFKFVNIHLNKPENWLFKISPEGFGTAGMVLNFVVTLVVSKFTPEPPSEVQNMVENIRYPGDAKS